MQTYSKENPSAHQRGRTENAEHLPAEICSLLCAGSRRISPEAEIFKHFIRSADLAQLQNLFPAYLPEIVCPAKMPACNKSNCAEQEAQLCLRTGKAEKASPILLKDWKMSHWSSQFQSVLFSPLLSLPGWCWNVSGACNVSHPVHTCMRNCLVWTR